MDGQLHHSTGRRNRLPTFSLDRTEHFARQRPIARVTLQMVDEDARVEADSGVLF
jgi:hypothetical protein